MEQSILTSTKKVLQIGEDDTTFDLDIMTHINSAFSTLNDLGVGPDVGFSIEDAAMEWGDFLDPEENGVQLQRVKTFIFFSTRLGFDPPTTAHLLEAVKKQLDEAMWRLSTKREETDWVDPDPEEETESEEGDGIVDGGEM